MKYHSIDRGTLKDTLLYVNVSILLWTPEAVPKPRILTHKRYICMTSIPAPVSMPPGSIFIFEKF